MESESPETILAEPAVWAPARAERALGRAPARAAEGEHAGRPRVKNAGAAHPARSDALLCETHWEARAPTGVPTLGRRKRSGISGPAGTSRAVFWWPHRRQRRRTPLDASASATAFQFANETGVAEIAANGSRQASVMPNISSHGPGKAQDFVARFADLMRSHRLPFELMMLQIIYSSAAVEQLTDLELTHLLARARETNTRLGATGILLYCEGSFLQVLEGDAAVLENLLERISRDKRHHRLVTLVRREIETRHFGDWAMGFVSPSRFPKNLPGYSDYLRLRGEPSTSVNAAERVLAAFRDGRFRSYVDAR